MPTDHAGFHMRGAVVISKDSDGDAIAEGEADFLACLMMAIEIDHHANSFQQQAEDFFLLEYHVVLCLIDDRGTDKESIGYIGDFDASVVSDGFIGLAALATVIAVE